MGGVRALTSRGYTVHEASSGVGQPDATCVAIEKDDAKVNFQGLDPCADARLTGAERLCRTMEAEIFRNGEHLDQGDHRDATIKNF